MQIARVGIEQPKLLLRGPHHPRVTVPHKGHIVVHVEESASCVVIQILHPRANNFERTFIRNAEVSSQQRPALFQSFVEIRFFCWKALRRNPQQEIRIWGKARPHRTLRRVGHAGKIRAKIQQIENDLEMKMRRPTAVFRGCSHAGKFLTVPDVLTGFESVERLRGQMSVEREKFRAVVRFMPQNHHRAVIQRSGIVRQNVNHSVKRRPQRRARRKEKIHA